MLIVELVGPAGSGKSTLTKALSEHDNRVQIGVIPNVRDIKNLPFFLWNGSLSLPTFLDLYRNKNDELLTAKQMIIMAILRGWPQQLKAARLTNQSIILIDQGPIYMLGELLRYGPSGFHNTVSSWWECVCNGWVNVLDMVICLDTSDAILMERVRARDVSHGIKGNSDKWAAKFLTRSRETQNKVLNSMTEKNKGMKVIKIDTSYISLSEAVQRILTLFDQ